MIQFYAPDILTNPILPESDSQHCIRVLRKQQGDIIDVIDGCGHRLKCKIVVPHSKRTLLEIVEIEEVALPWNGKITIAVAPTKHMDRMEWLVEKLVEIGVNRIVPLLCTHSERKEIKRDRIEKIAISAMKQSLKTWLPQIDEMTPIKTFIEEFKESNAMRYVAYCDPEIPRRDLAKELKPESDTIVLIGPEGDFSSEEIKMTLNAGFIPVSLGDCRLRTETAALASCQAIHVINQLMK